MSAPRLLAVIPARGGSRGLPGKNVRPLMGLPLIAHSIRLAQMCPEVTRAVVSTDSEEIASVARAHGGEVPFLRPPELARADTPMWPVLRHALSEVERAEAARYDLLLLLDPTSPTRLPEDVRQALALLAEGGNDGVVSVSRPEFNPLWHTVVEKSGLMTDWLPQAAQVHRRQDAPTIYRINGLLYLWKADFVRRAEDWRAEGRHKMLVVPDARAVSIDDLPQFDRAEALARAGLLPMPWLKEKR
jgi:N-acylneuraminate cytidylyltransferase